MRSPLNSDSPEARFVRRRTISSHSELCNSGDRCRRGDETPSLPVSILPKASDVSADRRAGSNLAFAAREENGGPPDNSMGGPACVTLGYEVCDLHIMVMPLGAAGVG